MTFLTPASRRAWPTERGTALVPPTMTTRSKRPALKMASWSDVSVRPDALVLGFTKKMGAWLAYA